MQRTAPTALILAEIRGAGCTSAAAALFISAAALGAQDVEKEKGLLHSMGSLLPLRPPLLDLSDQRSIGDTHAICEHLSDQDGDVPLGGLQIDDPGPTHTRHLRELLLRDAGTLSGLLENSSKDLQIFI